MSAIVILILELLLVSSISFISSSFNTPDYKMRISLVDLFSNYLGASLILAAALIRFLSLIEANCMGVDILLFYASSFLGMDNLFL